MRRSGPYMEKTTEKRDACPEKSGQTYPNRNMGLGWLQTARRNRASFSEIRPSCRKSAHVLAPMGQPQKKPAKST